MALDKKIRIGIVSGAGPMAGALLYQRIIEKLQQRGASRDAEFPLIVLRNEPFSEMLAGGVDDNNVREELLNALSFVSASVDYVYIACQTLHGFIEPEELEKFKVVSLLGLIKQSLGESAEPICIVASCTSRRLDLHPRQLQLSCHYIEDKRTDIAIDDIMAGKTPDLSWVESLTEKNRVLLGCTEFCVALRNSAAGFIDPIELAADDIVKRFCL